MGRNMVSLHERARMHIFLGTLMSVWDADMLKALYVCAEKKIMRLYRQFSTINNTFVFLVHKLNVFHESPHDYGSYRYTHSYI